MKESWHVRKPRFLKLNKSKIKQYGIMNLPCEEDVGFQDKNFYITFQIYL